MPHQQKKVAGADVLTPPAGYLTTYAETADDEPYFKRSDGNTFSMVGPAGADAPPLVYLDHGNTGATETVDASAADIHRMVANAATVTLTLSGAPASGTPAVIRLWLEQDGTGGRDWIFPGSVDFGDPGEPDWTSRAGGAVDLVDLMTVDGGTTWFAALAGREGPPGADATIDYGEDADIVDQDYDDVADAGALDEVARADHRHGMPSEGAGSSVTASENHITGDVPMTNANQFYDGPSLSLAAGTYVLFASVECKSATSGVFITAKLWDGTNTFDTAEEYAETSGGPRTLPMSSGPVVLASTTTVKVSCAVNTVAGGSGTIMRTAQANGVTSKASGLTALKIA